MYEQTNEEKFLIKNFKEYYKKNLITSVSSIEKREFGYGVFKRKIANRNLSFQNNVAMNEFLREKTPLFFSYSNSYYAYPNYTPMVEKKWLGSDLIYEFDADEIMNDCEKISNEWVCTKTFGEESLVKENIVEKETKQWFLQKSLIRTKKHVFRLIDLLETDLGFNKKNVKINFSGKAGYHIHLRNEEIQNLNKKARIELVDYITCFNPSYSNMGYDFEKKMTLSKKSGIPKKINPVIKKFFEKNEDEIITITKQTKQKTRQILKNKEQIITNLNNGHFYSIGTRTNKEYWKNILDFSTQTIMIPIDRQTSTDIHKIIRVPNTLHGETGFIAKELTLNELETFDPFINAIAFGNQPTKILITKTPRFELNQQTFGPYENETTFLPLYCAIYLIGKGVAKLI